MYHPAGQKFARNRSISYGFRGIDTFSFSAKIQDGRRKWRKMKFSPLHRTPLYHPAAQQFAQNRSISYCFRDIDTFSLSAKIQDGRRKWRKLKFSPFEQETLFTTLWVKKSLEIALSLMVFEILTLFHFPPKIQDGRRKWRKLKFSPIGQETLVPPCGSKICWKSLYLLQFSRY